MAKQAHRREVVSASAVDGVYWPADAVLDLECGHTKRITYKRKTVQTTHCIRCEKGKPKASSPDSLTDRIREWFWRLAG